MSRRSTQVASLVSLASITLSALALTACGGASAPAQGSANTLHGIEPAPDADAVAIVSFAKAPESGSVDKVGTVDGNFAPDQTPDLVFDAVVQGSPKALFITTVGRDGAPNKRFRADTLVGDQEAPEELGGMLEQGSFTSGIGVYEGGKVINDGDGSIPPMKAGAHTLKLYVNRIEALGAGGHVALYARGADGKLVKGPTVEY